MADVFSVVSCCLFVCVDLQAVDEGKFVNQFYHGHVSISKKSIILVLDRQDNRVTVLCSISHPPSSLPPLISPPPSSHPFTFSRHRSVMLIEKHVLRDVLGDGGWACQHCVGFKQLQMPPVKVQEALIIFNYRPGKVCGKCQDLMILGSVSEHCGVYSETSGGTANLAGR